jgi:hypothetical protein
MEEPTRNMQLALATLAGLVVGTIGATYYSVSLSPELVPASAGPMNALFLGLAFLSGGLLWWRHSYGYAVGLLTGVVFLVIMGFTLAGVGAGDIPAEWLVLIIPGIIIALVFLAATYLAWRE